MEWVNGKLFTFRLALVDYITMINTEFEFAIYSPSSRIERLS